MNSGLVKPTWGWWLMNDTLAKYDYLVNNGLIPPRNGAMSLYCVRALLKAESDDIYLSPDMLNAYIEVAGVVGQYEFDNGEVIV